MLPWELPPLLTVVLLIAVPAAAVAVNGLLEGLDHSARRPPSPRPVPIAPSVPAPQQVAAASAVPARPAESTQSKPIAVPVAVESSVPAAPVPSMLIVAPDDRPDAVPRGGVLAAVEDRVGGATVPLGPVGADRELAGVLFAAYVVGGFPDASRVTGWVTPLGVPEGVVGPEPGGSMRGRPGMIRRLLARDDRNWLTLATEVDIARGQLRRPTDCEVLRGLLVWWHLVGERPQVDPGDCGRLAAALAALDPVLDGLPAAGLARRLAVLAGSASSSGASLRLTVLPRSPVPEAGSGSYTPPGRALVVTHAPTSSVAR